MTVPEIVKRTKSHLALTLLISGTVIIAGPYVLSRYKLITELKAAAWAVLIITFAGIIIKGLLGYLTSGHFRHDKSAYELCTLVFGGTLTCFALQITSDKDLFPGIQNISFLGFLSSFHISDYQQHTALLALLLVGALTITLWAAVVVSDTEKGKPQAFGTLSSAFLSLLLLGTYSLALVAKG